MGKRRYIIVFLLAATVRVGFMLWSWSGYYYQKPGLGIGMYRDHFGHGYSIAAGYGYTYRLSREALDHQINLYERVTRENVRATPELAGPMPQEGVYPMAVHPPGMPLLVAGINRLLGVRADEPVQIIGIVLDSISAVIVCWMVGKFFSVRVGFAAGILYAFFAPQAYQAVCAKMPDGLMGFFVVASLACVLKASDSKTGRAVGWYILSGIVLGLGSYLRPNYVLMPLFLIVGLWAHTRCFSRSVGAMLLTQLTVFVVLLPWAYRNYRLLDHWIFTSTGPGSGLIVGLGQFSNPWGFTVSDRMLREAAQAQGIAHSWDPQADIYFRKLFWQSVRQDPQAWAWTVARRIPLAVATPYYWGYDDPYRSATFLPSHEGDKDRYGMVFSDPVRLLSRFWDRFIMAGLSLCSFVCVVVMWIKERHRWGIVLLLLSPHIYVLGTHVLIYFASKHVVGSMFCWLIGLAYVLVRGWRDRDMAGG